MAEGSYPDLHGQSGWKCGVHKAPIGYQHPWLVVAPQFTFGCWSRADAREEYRRYRPAKVKEVIIEMGWDFDPGS